MVYQIVAKSKQKKLSDYIQHSIKTTLLQNMEKYIFPHAVYVLWAARKLGYYIGI